MDQLGPLRRRAGGEVQPLDQRRAQAPSHGVEGGAGTRGAASDDEDVEGLGTQPFRRLGSVERRLTHLATVPGAVRRAGRAQRSGGGRSGALRTSPLPYRRSRHLHGLREDHFRGSVLGSVNRDRLAIEEVDHRIVAVPEINPFEV